MTNTPVSNSNSMMSFNERIPGISIPNKNPDRPPKKLKIRSFGWMVYTLIMNIKEQIAFNNPTDIMETLNNIKGMIGGSAKKVRKNWIPSEINAVMQAVKNNLSIVKNEMSV